MSDKINYRKEVERTANCDMKGITFRFGQDPMLVNAAMGLVGEAGEFADMVKKSIYHGTPLDRDKVLKEIGDCRWYMELACMRLNTSLEEIERLNVEKLRKRYPEGFDEQAALERLDVETKRTKRVRTPKSRKSDSKKADKTFKKATFSQRKT